MKSRIEKIIVPEIDLLTLDSIFPSPGRNDLCHCFSGLKYKRCCLPKDEQNWSALVRFSTSAISSHQWLPKFNYLGFNP
jgi:hypothetical protein